MALNKNSPPQALGLQPQEGGELARRCWPERYPVDPCSPTPRGCVGPRSCPDSPDGSPGCARLSAHPSAPGTMVGACARPCSRPGRHRAPGRAGRRRRSPARARRTGRRSPDRTSLLRGSCAAAFIFLRQKTPPLRAGEEGRSRSPCAPLPAYRRACGTRRLWSGADTQGPYERVSRSPRFAFGRACLVRCVQPRNPPPLGMGRGQVAS